MGKHPSNPFNPLLASAFFRAGYVESWGRGIEKIHRECVNHDVAPPIFDASMSGLMLTFKANPQHLIKALGEEDTKRLTATHDQAAPVKTPVKTPVKIIELLQASPSMTMADVAVEIGKSLSAVERASAKLVKEGRLKYVGPAKGGHWEVLK